MARLLKVILAYLVANVDTGKRANNKPEQHAPSAEAAIELAAYPATQKATKRQADKDKLLHNFILLYLVFSALRKSPVVGASRAYPTLQFEHGQRLIEFGSF